MARCGAICAFGVAGYATVNAASAKRMSIGTAGCTTFHTASFLPWISAPLKISPSDTIDREAKCYPEGVTAVVSAEAAATFWNSPVEKKHSTRWLEVSRKRLLLTRNN